MSAFRHIALDRPAFETTRPRRLPGAAFMRRRPIARTLAGQIWLHRIAACVAVAGAMLLQACALSLVAHFLIGGEAAALPDLPTCLYGLAIGAGMLGLPRLADTAIVVT